MRATRKPEDHGEVPYLVFHLAPRNAEHLQVLPSETKVNFWMRVKRIDMAMHLSIERPAQPKTRISYDCMPKGALDGSVTVTRKTKRSAKGVNE